MNVVYNIRKDLSRNHTSEVMENLINSMLRYTSNKEFVERMKKST